MQHKRRYILGAACLGAVLMTMAAITPAQAFFGKKSHTPTVSAFAKTEELGQVMTFSREDFEENSTGELSGIIVTSLPDAQAGSLIYSGAEVTEGNVISSDSLGAVSFIPSSPQETTHTQFKFIPIFAETGAAAESVTVSINMSNQENGAPIAVNAQYETYSDLPLAGRLQAVDPDGDLCTFEISKMPKYGTLSQEADGFVYTPTGGKKKTDSFTFKASDGYGNLSKEATVTVSIAERPTGEKVSYTDMADSQKHYAAVKLAEMGVLRGESIGAGSFLYPDSQVTRAQFVAMVSKVYSMPVPTAAVVTGMGDNDQIPHWAQPSVAAALSCSIVTGETAENGNRVFRAGDPITRAEAAVIIDRMLKLADDGRTPQYTDADAVPQWAAQSVVNTLAGGYMELKEDGSFSPNAPMTREDTAASLYKVVCAMEEKDTGFFDIFK